MRTIKEIKKRAGDDLVTDVFGVSLEYSRSIAREIWDNGDKVFGSKTELAICILEDVLGIKEYSPETLFRVVILISMMVYEREKDVIPDAIVSG